MKKAGSRPSTGAVVYGVPVVIFISRQYITFAPEY